MVLEMYDVVAIFRKPIANRRLNLSEKRLNARLN